MTPEGRYPFIPLIVSVLAVCAVMVWLIRETTWIPNHPVRTALHIVRQTSPTHTPTPSIIPTMTPSPTPTPTPMPQGPCATVRVLMYHHVESMDTAKSQGHASLTVDTPVFASQMEYLKTKGYAVIRMSDLEAFLYAGASLPANPVLLTFDDGYDDYATDAVPIMQKYGFPSTVFIPTGLMENPGYLTWSQLKQTIATGLVLAANHTWSHHTMASTPDVIKSEITTADTQLAQAGMNAPKTFAYPYGTYSAAANSVLTELGYRLGFSTVYGTLQCYGNRYFLPRIRVGNSPLSSYGL